MSVLLRVNFHRGRYVVPILLGAVVLASPAFRFAPSVGVVAGESSQKVWDFESDVPGKVPSDFSVEVGKWEVASDGGNHVLFQKAKSEDAVYNLALVRSRSYREVDLSVKVKAVAGEVDRGGGIVWRAKDKDNYYLCRYNPLEDNYRVFVVENGKRKQLASVKVPGDDAWHVLRATMKGPRITCYLDDKKLLQAENATFTEAGMIGVWSKADAQSYFDDLSVAQ